MNAPIPDNEGRRLAALRDYEILDTPGEQAFDDLTLLAAQLCGTPMAMVSLVDENRQWFKSRQGLSASETSRDIAFCAHTILRPDEVLEVRDAEADPRFADNPLVTTDPHIRFYAGAPLVSPSGHALGALCVMDHAPRSLTPAQLEALRALSRRVVAQLEMRRQARALVVREQEADRLLEVAEKSRRALLSVLEDEKRATRTLRESEARFRQVVETIHEVFWLSDVEKSRIIYISPGFEAIWGRKCEELYVSMNTWVQSIHEEDRERVLLAATTRQTTGEYHETYRILRPDGSIRWIRDRAFPVMSPDGPVRRVVGVAEDITERKQLEEQFLRAQRMEAIGTLAGGVAHDLNNILAPVLMAAGLLKTKLTTPHDQAILNMVETSALRGADIIRQLLTFSRGIEGARGIVQLRHLVKDMVHIMQETFPRNITVVQVVPHDLWPVLADATQIHQVIMNLCVNARDAMPEGGRLTLRTENLMQVPPSDQSLGPERPAPHVLLAVSDTGTGIPADIVERIFDPFFTTKAPGKGTGLGLSTVAGIVKSHGGSVKVASEPGKGTVFSIYLPASAAPSAPSAVRRTPAALEGQGELILLVDDEETIRTATRQVLEKNKYRVLVARDGREAASVFLANQDSVQLVLTDVMMPVMGGYELSRALLTIKPRLAIMAMTGLDQETKQAEFAAMGVTEVLLKPFAPEILLAAISSKLGRGSAG